MSTSCVLAQKQLVEITLNYPVQLIIFNDCVTVAGTDIISFFQLLSNCSAFSFPPVLGENNCSEDLCASLTHRQASWGDTSYIVVVVLLSTFLRGSPIDSAFLLHRGSKHSEEGSKRCGGKIPYVAASS